MENRGDDGNAEHGKTRELLGERKEGDASPHEVRRGFDAGRE